MASIYRNILIEATSEEVWDAVQDFGAVHRRLAPGFVVDCNMDGDTRVLSFANGNVARELLVTCDQKQQRLVYALANERFKHYSASVQVVADGERSARILWTIDLLPNEMAPYINEQMDQAALAMQKALTNQH